MTEGGYCGGCGLPDARCGGACGRASEGDYFCRVCGRRLVEYVVVPGSTARRCRDHWDPVEDLG